MAVTSKQFWAFLTERLDKRPPSPRDGVALFSTAHPVGRGDWAVADAIDRMHATRSTDGKPSQFVQPLE